MYERQHQSQEAPFKTITERVTVSNGIHGREELITELEPEPEPELVRSKKMSGGRPTQIHAVPLEERAFDSKGNRLPWALEWPE